MIAINIIIILLRQMGYGIDWNEPIPDSDDSEQADIPIVNQPSCILSEEADRLQQEYTVDRIVSSEYHATDLYVQLVDHVMSQM